MHGWQQPPPSSGVAQTKSTINPEPAQTPSKGVKWMTSTSAQRRARQLDEALDVEMRHAQSDTATVLLEHERIVKYKQAEAAAISVQRLNSTTTYAHKLTGIRVGGKPSQDTSQPMESSQDDGQPPSGPSGSGTTPKGASIAVGKISRLAHHKGMAAKHLRLRLARKTNPNDLALIEVNGPGEPAKGMAPPPPNGPTQIPGGLPGRGKLLPPRKIPQKTRNRFRRTQS